MEKSSNFDRPREKVYTPDFGQIGELYAQGFGNDIDLALRNPAYRPLVVANENDVDTISTPPLEDSQLIDSFVPKEFNVNELREYADVAYKHAKDTKDNKS